MHISFINQGVIMTLIWIKQLGEEGGIRSFDDRSPSIRGVSQSGMTQTKWSPGFPGRFKRVTMPLVKLMIRGFSMLLLPYVLLVH